MDLSIQVLTRWHRAMLLLLILGVSACNSASDLPQHTPDSPVTPTEQKTPTPLPDQPGNTGRNLPSTQEDERPIAEQVSGSITLPVAAPPATARTEQDAIGRAQRLQIAKQVSGMTALDDIRMAQVPNDRESYTHFDTNPVHQAARDPVSTFSIDVDTASYSNTRRWLNGGSLPRQDAVRVEELINYFAYQYPTPEGKDPFTIYTEMGPSPWHAQRHLLHIGIKGAVSDKQPPANLVFLIDVSGSMHSPDKLDLLKASMKLLTAQLDGSDRIAIAVYAGAAGAVLPPTAGDQHATINAAIDALAAGGSTNGGAGIQLAYALARQGFIAEGTNRVILATDGDFNVGTTDQEALKNLVESERRSGVALTVLGFGSGNYNDALMQELAQNGNGNAAYIDTLSEARKVLVDELAATLNTIASDVKIQVEFNPALVTEYRLIGYETRHLEREDFNNDAVDAGEVGAGHTVTALYEISLVEGGGRLIDPLRYGTRTTDRPAAAAESGEEIAFVKLRYKAPGSQTSRLISRPVAHSTIVSELAATSENYRFSAAVAGFGQLLRGGQYTGSFEFADAAQLAAGARGEDPFGYRGEFLSLVHTAGALAGPGLALRTTAHQ